VKHDTYSKHHSHRTVQHRKYRARHARRRVSHVSWNRARVIVTEYVIDPPDAWKCREYGYEYFSGTRTATGSWPGRGTIAVDTRVFPMGTRFYIPGYGYGIARDTGGAIIGHHIDAAVGTCAEAIAWGGPTKLVNYH
jgi:3D (Asp-Asp-Asp) domain-containing protein